MKNIKTGDYVQFYSYYDFKEMKEIIEIIDDGSISTTKCFYTPIMMDAIKNEGLFRVLEVDENTIVVDIYGGEYGFPIEDVRKVYRTYLKRIM